MSARWEGEGGIPTTRPTQRFVDERHALYVGWVFGLALKNGLPAEPIVDELGNYTDRIRLELTASRFSAYSIELVVPPPPADWKALDE